MLEKEEKNDSSCKPIWYRLCAMFTSIIIVATVFTVVGYFKVNAVTYRHAPHVIFILVDDLGWNDVSFHGSPQIPTPNIDALAASGVVLNNYYTHPECSPSRGALLTGMYANRLGLYSGNIRPTEASGLPLNIATLPQYLKKLGYKTSLFGKWHLGYYKKSYLPTRRGFDTFFGFLNENIDYFDYTSYYEEIPSAEEENLRELIYQSSKNNADGSEVSTENKTSIDSVELFGVDLWENEEVIRDFRGEYATDVFTEKAVSTIKEYDSLNPMFLLLSHAACNIGNSKFPPAFQTTIEHYNRNSHINDEKRRSYAGIISALDDSVGKIFQALSDKGMLEKSIIVISSDNGGATSVQLNGAGSNWPLRGSKSFMWEGGVRSVGLMWSPLLSLEKPKTSSHLMHISDWLPTLYHAAGGDLSDLGDIDGKSMWKVIPDSNVTSPREEVLLSMDPVGGSGGLRSGDMKLLYSTNPQTENDWYGTSGLEDGTVQALDDWVWSNGSVIRDILMQSGRWLLAENETWRDAATIICGENFMPVSGSCDFSKGPCLYNITDDPCEYQNLADQFPEVVSSLMDRLRELNVTSAPGQIKYLDPRGDPQCYNFAYVPWMDNNEDSQCVGPL